MGRIRWGRVRVSLKLLGELLKLPPGHQIIDIVTPIYKEEGKGAEEIELIIEGPSLPEIDEDKFPPLGTLVYHRYAMWEPYGEHKI